MKKLIAVMVIISVMLLTGCSSGVNIDATAESESVNALAVAVQQGSELLMSLGSSLAFVDNVPVFIDENDPQVVPYSTYGKIYVPAKFIAETFGGVVKWDSNKKMTSITFENRSVSFYSGDNKIQVHDQEDTQVLEMDTYTEIKNGRGFVPLLPFVQALGLKVFCNKDLIIIGTDVSDYNSSAELVESARNCFSKLSTVGTRDNLVSLIESSEDKHSPYNGVYLINDRTVRIGEFLYFISNGSISSVSLKDYEIIAKINF